MKINELKKTDIEALRYTDGSWKGSMSREGMVLELKLEGKTWTEIGERFKISRTRAQQVGLMGLQKIETAKILQALDRDPNAPLKVALLRIEQAFSPKTAGALKRVYVGGFFERVGDILGKSDSDMLKYPDFGKKALREVREFMARYSLT